MRTLQTISEIRAAVAAVKKLEKTVGFVPTMGALHQGHLSLVELARKDVDVVVVSIFVNPTQFGPTEDFDKYPRTIEEDARLLIDKDVEFLFLPSIQEIYPTGAKTFVEVRDISSDFEGALRPDHFRGVATVVAALLNIVHPDFAFFGQKDAQQVAVIKQMVRDLHFPVQIIVGDTVRENGALAMSSRNRYLSENERSQSEILSRALFYIKDELLKGSSFAHVRSEALALLAREVPAVRLDYLDMVDPETFQKLTSFEGRDEATVVIAARFGETRLLDNIVIKRE